MPPRIIRPRRPIVKKPGQKPDGRPYRPMVVELTPRFFIGGGSTTRPYRLVRGYRAYRNGRDLTKGEVLWLTRRSHAEKLSNCTTIGDLRSFDVKGIKPISFVVKSHGKNSIFKLEPDYEFLERLKARLLRERRRRGY